MSHEDSSTTQAINSAVLNFIVFFTVVQTTGFTVNYLYINRKFCQLSGKDSQYLRKSILYNKLLNLTLVINALCGAMNILNYINSYSGYIFIINYNEDYSIQLTPYLVLNGLLGLLFHLFFTYLNQLVHVMQKLMEINSSENSPEKRIQFVGLRLKDYGEFVNSSSKRLVINGGGFVVIMVILVFAAPKGLFNLPSAVITSFKHDNEYSITFDQLYLTFHILCFINFIINNFLTFFNNNTSKVFKFIWTYAVIMLLSDLILSIVFNHNLYDFLRNGVDAEEVFVRDMYSVVVNVFNLFCFSFLGLFICGIVWVKIQMLLS